MRWPGTTPSSTARSWRWTRPGGPTSARCRTACTAPGRRCRAWRPRRRSPTWSSTCSPSDGEDLLDRPYARAPGAAGRARSPGTAGWRRRGSRAAGPSVLAASEENGLEGVVAKRLDSLYRPGRAQPRLAQDQELPHPVGRRRRVAAGAGPADGRHRVAAGRRARRRGPAGLRRPRRHGVQRPGPARPAAHVHRRDDPALRRRPAARGHPRRALGRARPGGRGRLRGLDGGQPAAAPARGAACGTTWSPTTW